LQFRRYGRGQTNTRTHTDRHAHHNSPRSPIGGVVIIFLRTCRDVSLSTVNSVSLADSRAPLPLCQQAVRRSCATTKTPPIITAAAAAALVTDRHRHLPPRTPAYPRKQLSRTSNLARVSYRGHVSGEGANVEYRRRQRPGL